MPTVKGAELETTWEPVPGLRFNFAGGYEDTRIGNGPECDRPDGPDGGHPPGWMVVKPFVTQASNCILPTYVVGALLATENNNPRGGDGRPRRRWWCCLRCPAYSLNDDPVTLQGSYNLAVQAPRPIAPTFRSVIAPEQLPWV